MCTKMKTKTNDDGNNEDRKNMLVRVAMGRCGCFTLNLTVFVGTNSRSLCTVARSCVLQLFPASVQFRSQQLPSWDPQLTGPTGVDGGFLVQP